MDSFLINKKETEDGVIYYVTGYFSQDAGNEVYDSVDEYLKKGKKKVVMELSDCQVLNSTGISILMDLQGKIRDDYSGELLFEGLTSTQCVALRVVGLIPLDSKPGKTPQGNSTKPLNLRLPPSKSSK